jgi:pilus assembly protein Flp/PilA
MTDRINFVFVKAYNALTDEEGQAMTEYALILALIAVAALTVLGLLGTNITNKLQTVCNKLAGGTCATS